MFSYELLMRGSIDFKISTGGQVGLLDSYSPTLKSATVYCDSGAVRVILGGSNLFFAPTLGYEKVAPLDFSDSKIQFQTLVSKPASSGHSATITLKLKV
jgi:hypothetical protein